MKLASTTCIARPDMILMQDTRDSPISHSFEDQAKVLQWGCQDLDLRPLYNQESRRMAVVEKPAHLLESTIGFKHGVAGPRISQTANTGNERVRYE
jgi:hypothetical protein